ncbi:hypothetical protein V6N12_019668 [Hibiscus sabdariffa]|uniref:THH1/TOM1/TOM3 domain-containing protein n=1 Tax=Hibiscus sabdariffa TaxID=183260 RepID=A0ABR2B4Z5_9ROSI
MEFPAMVSSWWDEINESTHWQDGIFYTLCAAYALVSSVALIQLIRMELRVPEYSWTPQKVFHLMNVIVNGVRAVVFGFHKQVFVLHPKTELQARAHGLFLLFCEEPLHFLPCHYEQARSLPTDKLKISFVAINGVIYVVQVCIWVYLWMDDNGVVEFIGNIFIAGKHCSEPSKQVSLAIVIRVRIAKVTDSAYSNPSRLFLMLRCFPIESKGRRKKLHEVVLSAFDSNASLDVLDHPVLNLIYYMLVEILPSALVLYILRRLPPNRISAQYHPIR